MIGLQSVTRALLVAIVIAFGGIGAAHAGGAFAATPWIASASSDVRLIVPVDGHSRDGWGYAGVEIRLPAGAKTYWRTPGDTGVPPSFAFAGSEGLAAPEVLFPAPKMFDDGVGGVAFGYKDRVIYPVRFKRAGSGPAHISVQIDYGVCLKNMCVPAQAKLDADIDKGTAEDDLASGLLAAIAAVPKPVALGADAPVTISSVRAMKDGGDLLLTVTLRCSGKAGEPQLFIEADDSFSIISTDRTGNDQISIMAKARRDAPSAGTSAKPWGEARLTLVAGDAAIEAVANIDAALKTP